MKKLPSVSIIVPTSNRVDLLIDALRSLAKLDYPPKKLEVIVIDDGSTDETKLKVKKMIKDLPFKINYFCQNKRGISEAKKLGN